MRYRVYGLSGCLGEFVAFHYKISPNSKSIILAYAYGSDTSVDILYQEPIVTIKDDHGNLDYIEALGPTRAQKGGV